MKEYRFIYRHSALEEAEAILESAGIPVDSPLAQSFSTTISIGQPKKQVFTTDSHISTQPRWRAYSAWLSRKDVYKRQALDHATWLASVTAASDRNLSSAGFDFDSVENVVTLCTCSYSTWGNERTLVYCAIEMAD